MSSVFWCDDLNAPTLGVADKTWWDDQPHTILGWLVDHGCSADINHGIIFVPNEEIKTLFTLRWM
jgi:hypothetical protein